MRTKHTEKNGKKHGIKWQVIEEISFNEPLLLLQDRKHSRDECRCFALGKREAIMKKAIPDFKNEIEERVFWEQQDSTEFLEWENAKSVTLPNLKKSTKSISLRLPAG